MKGWAKFRGVGYIAPSQATPVLCTASVVEALKDRGGVREPAVYEQKRAEFHARRAALLLAVLGGCATPGALRRVSFDEAIDQSRPASGCFSWTPANGEVLLWSERRCREETEKTVRKQLGLQP
jgi:hypothetical protein